MEPISAYILTKNSQAHLRAILEKITRVADEVLIIDSGSTDDTEKIAGEFEGVRFLYNEFKDFGTQRIFATDACKHDMVLFVDSDEIPDEAFVQSLLKLKKTGFKHNLYKTNRHWNVLGKNVRAIYPVECPDHPKRLYRKSKISYSNDAIHEALYDSSYGKIEGTLKHITYQTQAELNHKLELYTDLAAKDILTKGKSTGLLKSLVYPTAQFCKWYFLKGGYKDGLVGWKLGVFAYQFSAKKFAKAKRFNTPSTS